MPPGSPRRHGVLPRRHLPPPGHADRPAVLGEVPDGEFGVLGVEAGLDVGDDPADSSTPASFGCVISAVFDLNNGSGQPPAQTGMTVGTIIGRRR
jgi:hypothetical protein